MTLGQPLGPEGDLGKAIEKLAHRICGISAEGKKVEAKKADGKKASAAQPTRAA